MFRSNHILDNDLNEAYIVGELIQVSTRFDLQNSIHRAFVQRSDGIERKRADHDYAERERGIGSGRDCGSCKLEPGSSSLGLVLRQRHTRHAHVGDWAVNGQLGNAALAGEKVVSSVRVGTIKARRAGQTGPLGLAFARLLDPMHPTGGLFALDTIACGPAAFSKNHKWQLFRFSDGGTIYPRRVLGDRRVQKKRTADEFQRPETRTGTRRNVACAPVRNRLPPAFAYAGSESTHPAAQGGMMCENRRREFEGELATLISSREANPVSAGSLPCCRRTSSA